MFTVSYRVYSKGKFLVFTGNTIKFTKNLQGCKWITKKNLCNYFGEYICSAHPKPFNKKTPVLFPPSLKVFNPFEVTQLQQIRKVSHQLSVEWQQDIMNKSYWSMAFERSHFGKINLWPVEHFFEHICHHFWVSLLLPKSIAMLLKSWLLSQVWNIKTQNLFIFSTEKIPRILNHKMV